MKKKTTWAASVVKKQLQTCCKHQTFSLETTERDDCTSQGGAFNSPLRVLHISSPIRETPDNPVLQRRKSFNVLHGRSLLTTPEPLTPFRKSVESAIPLCRSSSTFKSQRLQNVKSSSPELPTPVTKRKVVLHKSGPLPVLQQLLRGGHQGGLVSSPVQMRKQLSGPLLGGRPPSPKLSAGPSPQPRILKVKFSPTPKDSVNKLSALSAPVEANPAITLVKVKKLITPRDSPSSKTEGCPPPASSSSPEFAVRRSTETVSELRGEQCRNLNVKEESGREESDEKSTGYLIAAAVKIQAAYRGHQARSKFAILRESSTPSEELEELEEEDEDEEEVSSELSVEEAPSISTQMSRTDPKKQRRNPPPRVNKGWNGSLRSAQDHQALLRSRQEAAMKRERAMEYALSRQRWRTRGPASKGWITDDRVPDKPGWVRNWLERATRMSNQNSQNRVFNNEFEPPVNPPPESESLSMKSTVGMCTTDIGSVEVNLGWPLSLRQQHAAGLLNSAIPAPPPPPLPVHDPSPPPPPRRSNAKDKIKKHKFDDQFQQEFNDFSTSSDVVTSEESVRPEVEERRHYRDHSDDRESVGSCDGPVLATKLLSPVVVTKPRMQQQLHKVSNSNSLKEAAKLREKMQELHPQSQVSVALSDGNSADTTAASVQRPTWR